MEKEHRELSRVMVIFCILTEILHYTGIHICQKKKKEREKFLSLGDMHSEVFRS